LAENTTDIWLRKLEHIEIVLSKPVTYGDFCDDIYDSIILVHQAFPRIDLSEVSLSTKLFGYELKAPIMITGITGGHPSTREINTKLAALASKTGIALELGSLRALFTSKWAEEVLESYKVARELAENVPVIGNIGLNTLNDLGVDDIKAAVDKLKLDALAVHLNPAQELIQPEGDTRFNSRVLDKLSMLLDELDTPIIVKEVGTGLSSETVKAFYSIGIRYFDVAELVVQTGF